MSLVDYAASSDEEDEPHVPSGGQVEENSEKRQRFEVPPPGPSSNDDPLHSRNRVSGNVRTPSSKQAETVSEIKLPDASFLLNSAFVPSNLLNASDHSSRVAVAMAESAARKRESNGPTASYPRKKVPKGDLPHSRSVPVPDTVGSHLLPPQLAGRSNVVTEDINKLFVRKNVNSSTTE